MMSKAQNNIEIRNYLKDLKKENVRENILKGLSQKPKRISPRFFYDQKGSELFEEITKLEEYYPSRTEKELLSTSISKFNLTLDGCSIIELGSGDASKISLLFDQLLENQLNSITYYPMDVSEAAIKKSAQNLMRRFPLDGIIGIVADFTKQMDRIPDDEQRLFCFFGSTIGNFTKRKTKILMDNLGKEMNKGDLLLLGADIIKDKQIMEAAYNDVAGLTAAFNKNILNVINKHLDSNFNLEDFKHLAFYNDEKSRIEMHLEAKKNLEIKLGGGDKRISLSKGERIHTENSHKFNLAKLEEIGKQSNLIIKQTLMAENNGFCLVLYEK